MFCVFRVGIGRSYIQNIKPDYEKAIKDIYEEREKYVQQAIESNRENIPIEIIRLEAEKEAIAKFPDTDNVYDPDSPNFDL